MFEFLKPKATKEDKTNKKIVFSINGMHCVSCGMNIDGELEDLKGVLSASTNYAKGKCTVVFNPQQVETKQLIETVGKLGYSVTVEG